MRVVRVPSWARLYFSPHQLSGRPSWIDLDNSRPIEEIRREKRLAKRRERLETYVTVQPILCEVLK